MNVCSCGFGSEAEIGFLSPLCVLDELQLLNQFLWANFTFEGRKYNFGACVFLFLQVTGSYFRKIFCKCDMVKESV